MKTTDNKYRPLKNMYKCYCQRSACIHYKTKATTMDKSSWNAGQNTFKMQTFYARTLSKPYTNIFRAPSPLPHFNVEPFVENDCLCNKLGNSTLRKGGKRRGINLKSRQHFCPWLQIYQLDQLYYTMQNVESNSMIINTIVITYHYHSKL